MCHSWIYSKTMPTVLNIIAWLLLKYIKDKMNQTLVCFEVKI